MVDLIYCSTRHNFRQSSSSGCLTLLVMNATAVWISFLTRGVTNGSFATEWWNAVEQYLSNFFHRRLPSL